MRLYGMLLCTKEQFTQIQFDMRLFFIFFTKIKCQRTLWAQLFAGIGRLNSNHVLWFNGFVCVCVCVCIAHRSLFPIRTREQSDS